MTSSEEDVLQKAQSALSQGRPAEASGEYENLARHYLGADDAVAAYYFVLAAQYAQSAKGRAVELYAEAKSIYARLGNKGKCAETAMTRAMLYGELQEHDRSVAECRECVLLSTDAIRDAVLSCEGLLSPEKGLEISAGLERIAFCQERLRARTTS